MDPLPPDAAGRREGLECWAETQKRRRRPHRARVGLRTQLKTGLSRGPRTADRVLNWFADRLLDRGLETSGVVHMPEHEHPDRAPYVPSPWHVLPRALHYLGVTENDTFVDFGCGKGRIVHQAARWPFRSVIGVEISPDLAKVARTALEARRHQHRCLDVEVVISDVTDFEVPDDMTIGYLFRPFQNEVLDAVLGGIVDSIDRQPRRVSLIYVSPTRDARSRIAATGRFRLVKEQSSSLLNPRSYPVSIFESL